MSMGNVPITAGFVVATAGQFTFGIYALVILAKGGGKVERFIRRTTLIHTDPHLTATGTW